eukprot:343629-Prymnesium_polylepis.1
MQEAKRLCGIPGGRDAEPILVAHEISRPSGIGGDCSRRRFVAGRDRHLPPSIYLPRVCRACSSRGASRRATEIERGRAGLGSQWPLRADSQANIV